MLEHICENLFLHFGRETNEGTMEVTTLPSVGTFQANGMMVAATPQGKIAVVPNRL